MALPTFPNAQVNNTCVNIASGDGLTPKVINSLGLAVSAITGMYAANSDGIAHVLVVELYDESSLFASIGSVNLPAGQGYGGTIAIDLMALFVPGRFSGFELNPNFELTCRVEVAVVTGAVTLAAICTG